MSTMSEIHADLSERVNAARRQAAEEFQELTRQATVHAIDVANALRLGKSITEPLELYRLAFDARQTALGALEALEDLQREIGR